MFRKNKKGLRMNTAGSMAGDEGVSQSTEGTSSFQTQTTASSSQSSATNFSIMNYVYPTYSSETASASMAAVKDEPDLKKPRLQFIQSFTDSRGNLLCSSLIPELSSSSINNFYMVHKKLEERICGILCCTVCLDLPHTAIYQVSIELARWLIHFGIKNLLGF